MNNLKQLLTRPLQALPNKLAIFILVVAFLGFADATYLTIEHYRNVVPPCSITEGCEDVLTSEYSTVAGVPVSLAGSVYYLLILVGVFTFLESKNTKLLKWSLLLTIPGMLASLWFVFLQVFVINSYCLYCLISALLTTILFVTALRIFQKYKSNEI